MSLGRKLALVSLVLLVLPWAAWRFVGTTEGLLRQGEERALLATADTLARSLDSLAALPAPSAAAGLYVWPAERPLSVDGYADEWRDWPGLFTDLPALDGEAEDTGARLALAENGRGLYLMLRVRDPERRYRARPGAPARGADHLRLRIRRGERERSLVIAPLAPGSVRPREAGGKGERSTVTGEWQETAEGYSVELRLPRPESVTGLGVAVVDAGGEATRRHGTGDAAEPAAVRPLVRPRAATGERLAALLPADTRAWVVDADGWVIARAGALELTGPGRPWLRNLIYRYLLAAPLAAPAERGGERARLGGTELEAGLAGRPATRWRAAGGTGGVLVSAAQPLPGGGALLLERASDGVLLLTDRALGGMLVAVLASVALALAALLLFARRLSWRIRALRDAAAGAVDGRGEVRLELPEQAAGDEIGDLARGLGRTLESLRRYTLYLRSLTGRLAHELRTPLAVVTSSLDNVNPQALAGPERRYLERARGGASRLATLLRAMSEATRVEQSLAETPGETIDLGSLVADYTEAYGELYPGLDIRFTPPPASCRLTCMPELIGQMLDKLVDNAAGFAPPGGWIRLALTPQEDAVILSVANQGPALPQPSQDLFDALVSQRPQGSGGDRAHLGLGLTIVRLVAERHGGRAEADNLPGGEGVVFRVTLRDLPP